jgi:hypothetical protein
MIAPTKTKHTKNRHTIHKRTGALYTQNKHKTPQKEEKKHQIKQKKHQIICIYQKKSVPLHRKFKTTRFFS